MPYEIWETLVELVLKQAEQEVIASIMNSNDLEPNPRLTKAAEWLAKNKPEGGEV